MHKVDKNLNLEDYSYDLPPARIAQYPAETRDQSNLLVSKVNRLLHLKFFQIISELQSGDLLVINNSKVVPSQLRGTKETGGKVECLFLRESDSTNQIWECLLKGRNLKVGMQISFLNDQISARIVRWKKFGQFELELSSPHRIQDLLKTHAKITLPPYIKAPHEDFSRYQTIYSSTEGSIAAPTAGFHFTEPLLKQIREKGVYIIPITLHVGYSTFMPLSQEILTQHQIDAEYFFIPRKSANIINDALQDQKGRIIAVGTTTLKTLESAANGKGKLTKLEGWSDLFISPGYVFKTAVKNLITNFHMPKSSPLLMVCAFAGKERLFAAYREALSRDYRFYSFGDAMLIENE